MFANFRGINTFTMAISSYQLDFDQLNWYKLALVYYWLEARGVPLANEITTI